MQLSVRADLCVSKESLQNCHDIIMETVTYFKIFDKNLAKN